MLGNRKFPMDQTCFIPIKVVVVAVGRFLMYSVHDRRRRAALVATAAAAASAMDCNCTTASIAADLVCGVIIIIYAEGTRTLLIYNIIINYIPVVILSRQ